jgi:hypothetical protein
LQIRISQIFPDVYTTKFWIVCIDYLKKIIAVLKETIIVYYFFTDYLMG